MRIVPIIRVFAANPRQIRTDPLRTPLEWMVIHALSRDRVMSVTLHFITQRTDHLAMADIATFPHIDVTAARLERRIRPHARYMFHCRFDSEQRNDFDQP